MTRFTALLFACISLFTSYSLHAEVNPFRKAKVYTFGDNPAWYFKEGSALKSASRRDGGDTLYYHLKVNRDQLRLRLSKNDPSGELENTRGLDGMTVNDVIVDGNTLPRFDWCLQNQERPGRKLGAAAIVMNDACVNPGNGDFIINLDEPSKNALKFARRLEFVVEPYSRPIKLSFSMGNYSEIIARVDRPEPPPPPVVRSAPASRQVTAPVAAPKPAPKPKPKPVAKTCHAKPPAAFASVIKSRAYPCNDAAKKAQAEKALGSLVAAEKQKRQAEAAERKRHEEELRKQQAAANKVEAEWEKRQAAMWIERCQKHWDKGVSPCYCEKYLEHAPPGVNNTCGR
jgi:hypothetical protein